ncbi:MAG: hypothetical protein F4Y66_15005 [Acidimicrobiales bacterium]|nr:hypothetical protein [Acidimicrobiales bacterium]
MAGHGLPGIRVLRSGRVSPGATCPASTVSDHGVGARDRSCTAASFGRALRSLSTIAHDRFRRLCCRSYSSSLARSSSMTAQGASRNALRFVEDETAQQALLSVFERAREAEDPNGRRVLVMLVSRRLACLYEMLIASGQVERFDPDQFEVVTDRVLDASPPGWSDRRAILIDDVINLGSTLVDRYDDLVERVGDKHLVTAMVALRDRDRGNPAFAHHLDIESERNGGPLERTEDELQELARQLATCLYRSLTPYFTDFPIFAPVQMSPDVLEELICSGRWLTADVTARIGDGSQRAYSFVAAESTEEHIRRKAVAAAVELAELFKVRVYTAKQNDDDRLRVRIVPICVPGEVMPSRLDRALGSLEELIHDAGNSGLKWQGWKPRAKHRLLQMYLSACLAEEFWNDLRQCGAEIGEISAEKLEDGHLGSYFGEQHYDGVRNAYAHAMELYRRSPDDGPAARDELPLQLDSLLWRHPEVRQHARYVADLAPSDEDDGDSAAPRRPAAGSAVHLGQHKLWVQRILNIFGEIDASFEHPQAKRLRELSYEEYQRYRGDPGSFPDIGPRILLQGIRPREITDAVLGNDGKDGLWRRVVVTLALDIGNDLGIAVPTTIGDDWRDPVSRQFRSGEGAFLAHMSHSRLRTITATEAVEQLDALTRDAFGLPLSGDLSDKDRERATDRIGEESHRIKDAIPGDRLLQLWTGIVREVRDTSFIADFKTTIGGEDHTRMTFEIEGVLSQNDQELIAEDIPIEWLVYESEWNGRPVRSRCVRLVPPTASVSD